DNNRGERALRGVCVSRKNWNFTGSENGGHALAILLTLLETCKQNGVNPRHYLIDVLERIQDHPANRLHELLPYHWAPLAHPLGQDKCRLV
ncbi:Transposase IS66 family protein, partial [Ectothiorhodospira magna]